jgi:hypothetical protein
MEMVLWKTMQTVSLVRGIGIYNTTAEDMYIPYVRPQENGHRTFNRWFSYRYQEYGLLLLLMIQ